jgi:hypothetical protein
MPSTYYLHDLDAGQQGLQAILDEKIASYVTILTSV